VEHVTHEKDKSQVVHQELVELKTENAKVKADLVKETQTRTLFEDITSQDAGVTAKTLMDYLSYIFRRRDSIEANRFKTVKSLIEEHQF